MGLSEKSDYGTPSHRYEVNNRYRELLESKGYGFQERPILKFSRSH